MSIITLDIASQTNQRPSQSGNLSLALIYNELHVFTVANFTSETNPPYLDPEGDTLHSIKVLSLPNKGVVTLSAIPISINDIISVANLTAGNLKYQCDILETDGYTDKGMTFLVADLGSSQYIDFGSYRIAFIVGDDVNNPPSNVGDGEQDVSLGATLVFTKTMFTTDLDPDYVDPEGDEPLNLKIIFLPTNGDLKLNGDILDIDDIVSFTDIIAGNFTYVNTSDDTDINPEGFDFQISDAGSGEFRG